jgi:CRP/FNR family transcriptional regulator, cyclic AMP receptor protein
MNMDFAIVHTSEAEVYSLSIEAIRNLIDKHLEFEIFLKEVFDKEMHLYESLFLEYSNIVSQEKIINLLKRLNEKYGRSVGVERVLEVGLTHSDLAKLAHTSRQTVTTLFNKLRDKNLIVYDRRKILIRNIDKLNSVYNV